MKCRWNANFTGKGVCANGSCPYRGEVCRMSKHPEVCKYSDQYEASELVEILRRCASHDYMCDDCPASRNEDECNSKDAKLQAADMLEKLAAENKRLKMLLTDGLKEDDSDGKKT